MTIPPAVGTCEYCKHFFVMTPESEDGTRGGLCRRYPPRPVVLPQINALQQVQMTVQSAFGETISSQSCGEYSYWEHSRAADTKEIVN